MGREVNSDPSLGSTVKNEPTALSSAATAAAFGCPPSPHAPPSLSLLIVVLSLFTFSSAEHKWIIHESVKRRAGGSGVLQKGVSGVSEAVGAGLFLV